MTRRLLTVLLCMLALTVGRVSAQAIRISIDAAAEGKEISRDLIGIFYEDLSHAADGGLYAELVQNRSFEYSMADHEGWHALTGWEFVRRDGGDGRLLVDTSAPVHPNNPHYAVLGVRHGQGSVGLSNAGFDGIVIREGERYRFSIFARQLAYPGGPLSVRLEAPDGTLLGGAELPTLTASWTKYEAMIEATGSSDDARLVVLASHPGPRLE